jgi:hypothetical protein
MIGAQRICRSRHIANRVQLHAPTGRNIGHRMEQREIFV